MSYKDTLTLYEEQVAAGVPDTQAKIIAHQLGAIGDELSIALNGIKEKLEDFDKRFIKLDKDMFWMRYIGASMTISFFANIVVVAWLS